MNITERITKLVLARKPEIGPRGVKRAISNACGISYEAVRQWYAGDTGNIKNENLVAVAEKFNTTVDWLLSGDGEPPRRASADAVHASTIEPCPPITGPWRAIKIVGTAQMGTEGYWYALESADGYVEVLSRDSEAYALRLKGNSMAPAIKNGWVAVIEPKGQLIPGEYVMVRLIDDECMVKELLYANDVEVSLASVNDAYERRTIPIEQVAQIHHVGQICPPSKVMM